MLEGGHHQNKEPMFLELLKEKWLYPKDLQVSGEQVWISKSKERA